MPNEEDLLEVIAAAQAQLSGLRKLPTDEPGGDKSRMFQVDVQIQDSTYTYLLLRVPDSSEWGGCWYTTGETLVRGRAWIRWPLLRERLSKYRVINWIELVPKTDDEVKEVPSA
jgi:hypothetical protein